MYENIEKEEMHHSKHGNQSYASKWNEFFNELHGKLA
jgi:hypothetical protein